ncbi:MAG: leucyl/phenylalanyl-tRNA--protein transferase [Brevundimonas sp.]|jgi:leucyl/phenylalanyl-tRNA--protein transferase|uniref:leucyl/phenylalanyl-tRNA--protein transferase n=1 Tax=Brevundimonas sp. TaxID=1871086 RepID=UPI0039E3CEB0
MPPFTPDDLLAAYAAGVFPMADSRDDPEIYLVEPQVRAVLPLDRFRLSSRLARTVRQDRFTVSVSTDFEAVLDSCAAPAPGREDTWINGAIRELYLALHARGAAHSIECRQNGSLVGGLYGVTLGGAFFGESMFSRATDASKVALVHLVARMKKGGWRLLDAQFMTGHLSQFGFVETPQVTYLSVLGDILDMTPDLAAFMAPMSGAEAVDYARQPTTQAS